MADGVKMIHDYTIEMGGHTLGFMDFQRTMESASGLKGVGDTQSMLILEPLGSWIMPMSSHTCFIVGGVIALILIVRTLTRLLNLHEK